MRFGWWLLAGVLACSGSATPEGDHQSIDSTGAPAAVRPNAPTSMAELAPGDTLGALALMRNIIDQGNDAAATAIRRDTTMPSEGYRESRTLSLWRVGDVPVKLIATEPNDAGLMRLETIVWFVSGEIAVVQEPFAMQLVDADHVVLLTDEGMEPMAVPRTDLMAHERALVDSVAARLKVFGIGYP